MNVSTHRDAELHAATDRYARAILRMESGDQKARAQVLEAYRQLQALGSDCLAGPVLRRSTKDRLVRKYAQAALRGLRPLLATRYGPAGFLA